jgi:hypothetical protein
MVNVHIHLAWRIFLVVQLNLNELEHIDAPDFCQGLAML